MTEIRIRRGPASQLPADAAAGEPLLTTDTHNIYVGGGPGVMPVKVTGVTTEVQAALAMKANAVDLGTAAAKDVPATGNASAGQVVLGSDSRLSNSRTPTAHKATHAAGGSDAISPGDIGAAPLSAFATYNVNQNEGVDNTGTTECAAALQSAIDYAAAQGLIAVANGTYKTGSKVVLKYHADFRASTFNVVNSPEVAVEVSTGSSDNPTDILANMCIWLPAVNNMSKPSSQSSPAYGWLGQGIGVRAVNTDCCEIHPGPTWGFAEGFQLTAYSAGNVYNNIHLGMLDTNKINLHLTTGDANGWVNENNFIGGKFRYNSAEGTNVAGCRHILISDVGAHVINNNTFVKPSLEGDTPEYHVECYGVNNHFLEARWEATPPRIHFGHGTGLGGSYNVVFYGYWVDKLVVTEDAGCLMNNIYRRAIMELDGGQASQLPVIAIKNSFSNSKPALCGYANDQNIHNLSLSDTAYSWALSAYALNGKATADAYPRVQISFLDGRVYFGAGTANPTAYFRYSNSGPSTNGNLTLEGSAWNGPRLYLGAHQMWVDTNGQVRVKNGAPIGDTDGNLVGPLDAVPTFLNGLTLGGSSAGLIPFANTGTALGPEKGSPGDWSAFSKQAGWAASGVTASATAASNGYGIANNMSIVVGHTYQVTFTVDSRTAGGVQIYLGGTLGTSRTAVGTYTETLVAGASLTVGLYTVGSTTLSVSGLSVKEVLVNAGPLTTDSGLSWDNTTKTLSAAHLNISSLPVYADNAAAVTGGLAVGALYRQGDFVAVVH